MSNPHLHCGTPAEHAPTRNEDAAVLDIDVTREDGSLVVRAVGELDIHTSPRLRERVLEVLDPADTLIVDLLRIEFLSTSGIAALLDIGETTRRLGVRWKLVAGTRSVLRPLEVSGVGTLLPVGTSMGSAKSGLRSGTDGG